ncbi:MAG TPA: hypothetical protein PKA33_19280 [Amaricoccus sp.]|uniref:hypothetical protein n=1 Tax=Amaricoccus sp. TaxID=1872485 RepID=UPI002C49D349|nr:hypothetical protein [Amaricoccus sp.]HMQ94589.1 hypothetical protein [Amaricoccus sp.]HMR54468.1 hypothetical protein [Amaricoccus sp.]HMU01482.1 hypothetical protein [Amaricoccus sp.]
MQHLSIILAVLGILPGVLALSDRFESWRKYLFPLSSGILGILLGIIIANFIEADLKFDRSDLFTIVLIFVFSYFTHVLINGLVDEKLDANVRSFFALCLSVIGIATIIYVFSIGDLDYSDQEINEIVSLNVQNRNYERAINLLNEMKVRHRQDDEYKGAIDIRIDSIRKMALGAQSN